MKAGGTMELQKALQAIRTKELQSIYLVIGSEMFLQ
jgi:DNA polymerase-3 subunit delta